MDRAAGAAGALLAAGVERVEERRQVLDDALQLHFDAVQKRVAFGAEPLEAVDEAFRPLALDDEADAARHRALRRMADMRRQEEDRTLGDGHVAGPPVLAQAQHHVALELIEEL